jgi:hypothetical protein
MIGYASNTGTRRNLEALRAAGWRVLLTPENPILRTGLKFGCDNGAWSCYQQNTKFNERGFVRLIDKVGGAADFVIIPDIVAAGKESLDFSRSWMPRLRNLRLLLLPIQDGMSPKEVGAFLREYPNVGLFLGGSTEWKLCEMFGWGMVAHSFGRYYHIGRVNTARRIQLAEEAGAHSFDGTSASRYASTLPLLESSRQQQRLFTARNVV